MSSFANRILCSKQFPARSQLKWHHVGSVALISMTLTLGSLVNSNGANAEPLLQPASLPTAPPNQDPAPAAPASTRSTEFNTFRDQVSGISPSNTKPGAHQVTFVQRNWSYQVDSQNTTLMLCLMRSVKLLKDAEIQIDPETRAVTGCKLTR
ncbi:MAG: hypothetical protein RJB38_2460 [Pseudomonadota bacterium]|jgi:hypothetical protein